MGGTKRGWHSASFPWCRRGVVCGGGQGGGEACTPPRKGGGFHGYPPYTTSNGRDAPAGHPIGRPLPLTDTSQAGAVWPS